MFSTDLYVTSINYLFKASNMPDFIKLQLTADYNENVIWLRKDHILSFEHDEDHQQIIIRCVDQELKASNTLADFLIQFAN